MKVLLFVRLWVGQLLLAPIALAGIGVWQHSLAMVRGETPEAIFTNFVIAALYILLALVIGALSAYLWNNRWQRWAIRTGRSRLDADEAALGIWTPDER